MPVIGSKKYPFDEKTGKVLAEDRGPKGDSILKDGKWVPILEALRGTLVKKGIKISVLYRSNISVRKYFDKGFGKKINWSNQKNK